MATDQLEQAAPENRTSAYLSYVEIVLTQSDFDASRKQLISYIQQLAEWVLGYFNTELGRIFEGQPFVAEQRKYRLDADLHASQLQKISQAFHYHLASGLAQLQDLKAARASLVNQFISIAPILQRVGKGADFSETAKNSLYTVLAVSNPLIGIPMVALRFFNNLDKANTRETAVIGFQEQFQRYLHSLHEFEEEFPKQAQAAVDYLHRKFAEINVEGISEILTDLNRAGYSIDYYTRTLDFAGLHDAEQQL